MGSELNVRVTEQELEYRSKNYRDIRGIEQRQLSCCSCGNVLSPESGRVFSHPIFGILQCENCKNHFKTVTFSLEKDDSVRVCHICGRERKNTYGCKKQDCPYEYCKNCIKRTIPKSLVDAESGKWKCFACNTQPLWKLRGACAAVMNSLPKRTKTKKVKSRNRSSDSEDETSNLRKVSYVKRTRLENTEKLKKRLLSVCDAESPTQTDEPQLQVIRNRRHENPGSGASKRANVSSSSDDSDLEEIKIVKPKTVVKSQSERRVAKNARAASTHGKSRSSHKTHARSVVIALSSDSSSDEESSDVGKKTKENRKSKSHVEERNEKSSSRVHGKASASGETMPSTRKTRHAKKVERKKESSSDDEVSVESDDGSSDDSETKAIKDLMPSLFAKDKSREKKKSVASRSRRDSSEEEPKTSRDKSKGAKSKSSNVSSKPAKNAKPRDVEEATDDDDDDNDDDDDDGKTRKKAKKPLNKSPGPKSFKEGTKPRKEKLSTLIGDDSDHSALRRSSRDKQKRLPASDSSSGKEFKDKKVLRPKSVRLRNLSELNEDLTTPAIEAPEADESDIMTKDQAFALKNSLDNFYKELKAAATKLLNDVEEARKSYFAKNEIRVDDANRMVLETKNVAKRFREIVDKSDTKVTEDYDRWCTKTRVKNVLRRSTRDANRSSRPASEVVEEVVASESSNKSNASDKSKTQSTLANGAKNVVVSECDSSDIFSADESRRSNNHSSRRDSEAAGKDDQVENVEAAGASDASLFSDAGPDESKKAVVDSSEKEAEKAMVRSPTMSEFSGRSDNEVIAEDVEQSHEKVTVPASEIEADEPMDTSSDPLSKGGTTEESEKEEVEKEGADESRAEREKSSRSVSKIRSIEKINSGETVASDNELEVSKESGHLDLPDEPTEDKEPPVDISEKNEDSEAQNDASIVGDSPEIAKVDKIRGNSTVPDSDEESEASTKAQDENRENVADSEHEECKPKSPKSRKASSKSPKSSQRSQRASEPSGSTKDKEISAVDSETAEQPKAECEKSDEAPTKVRKTRKTPSVSAANVSDGEGSEGSKKVSSSKAASRRPSADSETPVDEESVAATDEKSGEEASKSARKSDAKSRKKNASLNRKSSSENDEKKGATTMDDPAEVEGCDIASASTLILSREASPAEKEDNIENAGDADAEEKAESAKDPSSPKPTKKISDTAWRSSSETMLLENSSDRENSPQKCETDSSTDIVTESQNAKAKMALLESSNSDDSTSDEREFPPPRDSTDAPLTPPESDTKSETNLANDSSAVERTESNDKTRRKRSKLRLNENRYYMADPKLKRKCVIRVERLNENVLRRYSRALRKSKEYVESKNLKRLVRLDKLDKNNKKVSADTSDDEDESSSKDLKPMKSKSRAAKEKGETLLDHLNKVDNGEAIASNSESDADSSARDNREKAGDKGEEDILAKANEMAKKRLLESSDSNAEEEAAAEEEQPASDTKDEKTKKVKQAAKKEKLDKSSDNEEKKEEESEKNRWRKNKLLTSKISDSDSDQELKKFNTSQEKIKEEKKKGSQSDSDEEPIAKKQKKKRVRRRVLHSDSDAVISEKGDSDSESSVESIKNKKKKKKGEDSEEDKDKKKTRKRTRKGRKGSSDSSGSDERPKPTRRKRIKRVAGSESDSDDDPDSQGSPGKAGRKNIRKVIRDKQVADDTKQAAKAEEERLKRIAERQKLYNEMYENRLAGEEKVDKLVLDFDEETKEPLVSVDEGLVKRLKPHQAKGIKFMWDACFESLERAKSTKGSGCILAHCMGLGKTFQVVTLSHTLLTHEETGVRTILVVCPLSTVLNWANEFKIWLEGLDNGDDIEVYEMTKMKKNFERKFQLARWQETGGVMIIGYEMFRNLTQPGKKVRKNIQETFLRCLVDPGPDLIVCDEGHLLKKEDTALSKAMRRIKTLRRVVLTGTPLQNNLIEYHCMVQFVKPNLLGTKKEFMNRFENPITNGQFDDSTEYDVKLMKKRAHILHKLLEGSVQRFDYSVLTPFLPPKQEYVIFVRLTKIQIDMYRHYLENYARKQRAAGGSLFADFQALQRIWTHPMVMQMNAEKVERANEKKRLDASDTEGSLKDFIDDESDTPCSSSNSDDGSSDEKEKKTTKRSTRANPVVDEPADDDDDVTEVTEEATNNESQWWTQYVKEDDYEDIRCSSKLMILFRIIKESEQIGDKLLVFSQSLYSLTLIETFLKLIDDQTQKSEELESLDGHTGSWSLGLDYFRLDGQTSADNRRRWCDIFNRPTNTRARLFLISTRAGGLGINLTAANRVVIFDASWNPSHDVQSIFRIYRFGQKKPCYVYRLLAAGTMEEKIYNRQVTKLSLSCRVVDEQQIERHYSNNALAELYQLELPSEDDKTLNLPKDRLLAEIFSKYRNRVENYHEHDSLLENQAGEELDEEERKQAWVEYEEEKKGKRTMPPMGFNYQDPMLMQQLNMMNMGVQNMMNNPAMLADYQKLQRLMEKDYPGLPEAQQKSLASRAVYEMYNYVEQQAMSSHGAMNLANLANMNISGMQNMAGIQGGYNNQMAPQSGNPAQTFMDVMRMQQALAQQQNGQIKFANNQQQLRNDILRQQQQLYAQSHNQNKQPYAQKQMPHLQAQSTSSLTPITIDDDDIMEVLATTDQNLAPPTPAVDANPKNKEE